MEIVSVSEQDLREAAEVHAISWRDSHRAVCSPEFVAVHTTERQEACFRRKMSEGSEVFLLRSEGKALGVMSLTGSTVADLYVLPEERRKGYGAKLLEYAIGRCRETPRLWIMETNTGAERLYRRFGFRPTGKRLEHPGGADEIEMALEAEKPAAFP